MEIKKIKSNRPFKSGEIPCYACGRKLTTMKYIVDTRDDQLVNVGKDCYDKIIKAGEEGVTVNEFGLKLYLLKK